MAESRAIEAQTISCPHRFRNGPPTSGVYSPRRRPEQSKPTPGGAHGVPSRPSTLLVQPPMRDPRVDPIGEGATLPSARGSLEEGRGFEPRRRSAHLFSRQRRSQTMLPSSGAPRGNRTRHLLVESQGSCLWTMRALEPVSGGHRQTLDIPTHASAKAAWPDRRESNPPRHRLTIYRPHQMPTIGLNHP